MHKIILDILALILLVGVSFSCSAEEPMLYDCWILCKPGTEKEPVNEVLIRARPGRKYEVVGGAPVGAILTTDGKERYGWVHLLDLSNETGEGWISDGYVVFEEPREVNAWMTVCSKGRVAFRKCIGGKRIGWGYNGDPVYVYWMTDEVAVTAKGYILSEFLID